MLMADIAIINKVDTASAGDVREVKRNISRFAPRAEVILAESPPLVENPDRIRGKRVLVVEDGPTLTHGGMPFGAATLVARRYRAAHLVDPRPCAVGTIREVFSRYPHIGSKLPAMGYGDDQIRDLEQTINAADCDLIVFATPVDLNRIIRIDKPSLRVRYEYKDHRPPYLEDVLLRRMKGRWGDH
jgi:predicted GTPase